MKLELKIVIGYLILVILLVVVNFSLPHREFDFMGVVNVSLQILIGSLSLLIVKHTEDPAQRMIFVCSAIYFGSGLFLLLSSFAGKAFLAGDPYGQFFYYFYVNKVLLACFSSLAVLSIAVDFMFHTLSAVRKSALTLLLTCCLVFAMFSGTLLHPFSLFDEYDYVLLSAMTAAASPHAVGPATAQSDAELAAAIQREAVPGSALSASGNDQHDIVADIGRLKPYLQSGANAIVFWRPLDLSVMYVHALLLGVIALILLQFYRINADLGAYVDKILILFFLFFSIEIFHAAGFLMTPNAEDLRVVFRIGQYVTIFCLLLMVYAYDMKLRFALSVVGRYYEFAVQRSPENVTRWRDELDRFILRAFLKKNHGYNRLGIFSETDTSIK